jgi:hypothetical protein
MAQLLHTYARWEKQQAEQHAANARVQNPGARITVEYSAKGVTTGQNGVTSIGVWRVMMQGGSGGSGGSGAIGQPAPAPAPQPTSPQLTGPAATQAGLPGFTGGGPRFQVGAQDVRALLPQRLGDFQGLDSFTPPNKIGGDFTPDSLNWDDIRRIGSRCSRAGTAKLTEDISTVQTQAFATASVTEVPANADLLADADYILFTRDGSGTPETFAFWFDTTGNDTEPAGSVAADHSFRVLTVGLTATQVAVAIRNRFNSVRIGEILASSASDTLTFVTYGSNLDWTLEEFITDPTVFDISQFATTAAGDLHADYDGLSISRVPATEDGSDQLILAFKDKGVEIGDSPVGFQPVSLHLVTADPAWGGSTDLARLPAPSLSLAQIAGPRIQATISQEATMPGREGIVSESVKGLIVLYSSVAYPEDPFNHEGLDTAIEAFMPWFGQSTVRNSGIIAPGTYFVSAWSAGAEGISPPARARIVIT